MQDGRLKKLALKYQPVRKQSRGRPKEMERPVLGKQLRNTGVINLDNISGR
jgi:hypothetical protein